MFKFRHNSDICDADFISTPGRLKSMHDHGGNRTYDPWNANLMLSQLSYAVRSVRVYDILELSLLLSMSI